AIDICQTQAVHAKNSVARATFLNSTGAAVSRLKSLHAARPYYEEAISLLDQFADDEGYIGIKLKSTANLAHALGYEGHEDVALRVCHSVLQLVSEKIPYESSVLLNSYIYSLIRAELYEKVLIEIPRALDLASRVPDLGLRKVVEGLLYYNAGCASEALEDYATSLNYYLKAADVEPLPEPYQGIARMHLFLERPMEAIRYTSELYRNVWGNSMANENVKLADSLYLIGLFAHYAGQTDLSKRCVEKAEIYLGQACYWNEWLKVRDFDSWVSQRDIVIPEDTFDWPLWHQFLDELSLIDSFETMFPRLSYVPRYEANLAAQLYERIVPDAAWDDIRRLQVAGRLVYLGLTVMTSNDEEAVSILSDRSSIPEIGQLGVRLLEAYPHSENYRYLIPACRKGADVSGLTDEDRLMAECLGLSLDYVELMELYGLSHDEAMQELEASRYHLYDPRVVESFRAQMMV
ncbi:MAG: hypothetical protein K6T68_06715, partial [Alicyclobacillus shizuokensis]|nr:hypothetical protein [Alicyclobacillus shizuokensis]